MGRKPGNRYVYYGSRFYLAEAYRLLQTTTDLRQLLYVRWRDATWQTKIFPVTFEQIVELTPEQAYARLPEDVRARMPYGVFLSG